MVDRALPERPGPYPLTLYREDPTTGAMIPWVYSADAEASVAQGLAVIPASAMQRVSDVNGYIVGDAIGQSTSAGSVVPILLSLARAADKATMLNRLRLSINDTAWATAAASIRTHLFNALPTPLSGDNAPFSIARAGYLGYIDITMDRVLSDGSFGVGAPLVGPGLVGLPASGTVNFWSLLETRTAVTPASGAQFTLTAETWRG